jgi:hypothetical protein
MARRTRRTPASEPDVAPEPQPAPVEDQGVELLEDRMRPIAGGSTGRRFGASIPGAVAGVFLIVAMAFGAGGQATFDPADTGQGAGHGADVAGSGDGTTGGDTLGHAGDGDGGYDEPDKTGDDEVAGEETSGGESAEDGGDATGETGGETAGGDKPDGGTGETDKPDESPNEPISMEIGLGLDGAAVVVEWSRCEADGFKYYKIVRSTNESVSWPLGDGDTLVAVREDASANRLVDYGADAGRTHYYRVFGVGYAGILCRTTTKSIKTPEPEPQPEPQPKPNPDAFGLEVGIVEGHPKLSWGSCGDVAYTKFKIVRSSDSTVTWPTGDNDSLIGAVGPDDHRFYDKEAPGGKKLFYRVFCVLATDGGYKVAAASNVASVTTPTVEPPPDPVTLGFETDFAEGGVVLHWQQCTSDGFVYYKVVRSMNENPSYLPWTDGTELINVIENPANTSSFDGNVESGQTWFYRIQCIGYWNGQKVLLGQTAVKAVTIP